MLTDLSFLNPGQPWPPLAEKGRLTRYGDNDRLFAGDHMDVFGDWVRLVRADQRAALEVVINLPKRVSTLWADLLVGEPPRFSAGDDGSPAQVALDRLVGGNALALTTYEVALDISRHGDGVFKVRLENGAAVIEGQPPEFWFPVLSPDNLRVVQAHVLAWTFKRSSPTFLNPGRSTTYLRAEIHFPGRIENRLFLVDGTTIDREVDLSAEFPERQPVEQTGVAAFLVVPVAGLRTTRDYHGQDDYTDIVSLVQELEVRMAQIARILDKHSDPSMYGPDDGVEIDPKTGETVVTGGSRYFRLTGDDVIPGYVTWDGQLKAAFEEIERIMDLFYLTSETSPAAFGDIKTGQISSGAALHRLMQAPLAKVNRLRLRVEPALKEVLRLATELEAANNIPTPTLGVIQIEWREGLPEDPAEVAAVEATRVGAGISSRYSALKRIDGGTDQDIQQELDRINEDEAQRAGTAAAGIPPLVIRQRVNAESS